MNNSDKISEIAELAYKDFEARTLARDNALTQARSLTRHAANAIRAIHRSEKELAHEHLSEAKAIVGKLRNDLRDFPDLYHAGYTQDAIKEYCEATLTCAFIEGEVIPTPAEMDVPYSTYLRGMAETPGELRRRCMDILRMGYSDDAENLLGQMDDIYSILITMDYPDAVTNGLRRQTDLLRGIVERTRADLTLSLREEKLKSMLQKAVDVFTENQ
jgi:translin